MYTTLFRSLFISLNKYKFWSQTRWSHTSCYIITQKLWIDNNPNRKRFQALNSNFYSIHLNIDYPIFTSDLALNTQGQNLDIAILVNMFTGPSSLWLLRVFDWTIRLVGVVRVFKKGKSFFKTIKMQKTNLISHDS